MNGNRGESIKQQNGPQRRARNQKPEESKKMTTQTAEQTGTAAEQTQAAEAPETAATGKDKIYLEIAQFVQDKVGKKIGKTGGNAIFDMVVRRVFEQAVSEGSFRFNGGHGSLHVRQYQAGSRRLPKGQQVTFGERMKMRYEEGTTVQELIKAKGGAPTASGNGATGETTQAPTTAATLKTAKEGEVDLA